MQLRRRGFLATAAGIVGSVAGCAGVLESGGDQPEDDSPPGYGDPTDGGDCGSGYGNQPYGS